MKAAVLLAPNQVKIQDFPTPEVKNPGEVIATVKFVGVCKTDHQLTCEGVKQETILGHEVVCQLPNEEEYFALNNEISCGKCTYCEEGLTSHCLELKELGINNPGGYAEKMLTPRDRLYPFEFKNPILGTLVEPLTCAVHAAERIMSSVSLLSVSNPTTFVIGGGISGCFVSYLLSKVYAFSGNISLYDTAKSPITWAENLGIQRLKEPMPRQAHLVIECSGYESALINAFSLVRNAGAVCIYGVPSVDISLPLSPQELFFREIMVFASFAGVTDKTIAIAIQAIKNDEAFFEQLLGWLIPLEKLPTALTSWSPKSGTRTVVVL